MITNEWLLPRSGFYISPDRKILIIKVRDPARILTAFPQGTCQSVPFNGNHLVAMPYHKDTLMLLRAIGADTTGAEVIRYTWPFPLVEGVHEFMDHQLSMTAFLSENPRAFNTSTMRTGKTASAIVAARYLQRTQDAGATLIVATVSNMDSVWHKEIKGLYPEAKIVVLHDVDPVKRTGLLDKPADFYIINYDGIKLMCDELCDAVQRNVINSVIIDELTHYQNSRSQLWEAADTVINGTRWQHIPGKTIRKVDGTYTETKPRRKRLAPGKAVKYVWGLTGTPGGPDMIYGQVLLVNPRNMNMSYTAWRSRTQYQIGFKWFPLDGHKEVIYQHMQPCIRFDKKEVMDLPPVSVRMVSCDLSDQQRLFYREIKRDMMFMSEDVKITAKTKSVVASKLVQIAAGVVIGEDGAIELDNTPRMNLLHELIKTTDRKVVIFSAYTNVIARLLKDVRALGYTAEFVDGSVSKKARQRIFTAFQKEKDPHIIICHPKTTAFGVELAAADLMIFNGPPLSGTFVYQQAVERLSSLKQESSSINIVQLTACYEERELFKSIEKGVSVNEAINDMFNGAHKE